MKGACKQGITLVMVGTGRHCAAAVGPGATNRWATWWDRGPQSQKQQASGGCRRPPSMRRQDQSLVLYSQMCPTPVPARIQCFLPFFIHVLYCSASSQDGSSVRYVSALWIALHCYRHCFKERVILTRSDNDCVYKQEYTAKTSLVFQSLVCMLVLTCEACCLTRPVVKLLELTKVVAQQVTCGCNASYTACEEKAHLQLLPIGCHLG